MAITLHWPQQCEALQPGPDARTTNMIQVTWSNTAHFDLCIFTKVKWPMRAQRCAERLGIWESIIAKVQIRCRVESHECCWEAIRVHLGVEGQSVRGGSSSGFFRGTKNGGLFFFRLWKYDQPNSTGFFNGFLGGEIHGFEMRKLRI